MPFRNRRFAHLVRSRLAALAALAALAVATVATAHHSFTVYDFEKQETFEGVVATLEFRNPHMTMTLSRSLPNGEKEIIDFVEGAPANMVARAGLLPEMIKPGTAILAIGSPRKDNPKAYFIRKIRLADGREWNWP